MTVFLEKIVPPTIFQRTVTLCVLVYFVNGIIGSDSGALSKPPPAPINRQYSAGALPSSTPQLSGSGSHGQRSSYSMLSQAMSQAVHNEFGSASAPTNSDQLCAPEDMDCHNYNDHLGLEAIRSLHEQLDDDDNGDIDLSESDDFLREELKYDSGYEKRHKAFHFNDDMHISVKELWEAWLKSEVHNWTQEQTSDWLIQSVQLPQYVGLFKKHKIMGRTLPRLAVHNMHFIVSVLGIKDPIHKQKIALKAMDAVLFGPPRETGTRWKDLVLVALLLGAIIGMWYAYQQNKNAKVHLRRMVRDMESLHKAEVALQDMQTELEKARMEQENVGKEKMDLERRLKEAPSLRQSNSEVELQQLKQEIALLRTELSRAEVELIDHHWQPPQGLQLWLQLTYELESKSHQKKRVVAEKQLLIAREACEKLKKKRTSFVGAFVSTHGKSIDDVDRSIVEARNSLSDVTNELQERLHRWKQIETILGFNVVNNNGIAYLENMLYRANGSSKSSRARITSSQDDLDDDSIQGFFTDKQNRDETSSEDGESVTFTLGPSSPELPSPQLPLAIMPATTTAIIPFTAPPIVTSTNIRPALSMASNVSQIPQSHSAESNSNEDSKSNVSSSSDRICPIPPPPRVKKQISYPNVGTVGSIAHMTSSTSSGRLQTQPTLSQKTPMPPPRRTNSNTNIFPTQSNMAPAAALPSNLEHLKASGEPDAGSINSSDSSSFDEEVKKRRRKLFSFGKKSSNKQKIKNA